MSLAYLEEKGLKVVQVLKERLALGANRVICALSSSHFPGYKSGKG